MEVLPTSFYLSVLILCSEELCSYSEIQHCIRTLWITVLSRMLFSRREAPCILEELNKNGYTGSHQGNQNTTSDTNWEQQQSRRLCNYIFPSINFQFQQSASSRLPESEHASLHLIIYDGLLLHEFAQPRFEPIWAFGIHRIMGQWIPQLNDIVWPKYLILF